jgi:hypothetical protein
VASRKIRCPFCGRTLYYAGEDFLPRMVLPPVLEEGEIPSLLGGILGQPLLPPGLAGQARVLERRRLYLPFYLLVGKRGGVLETGRERLVTDALGARLRRFSPLNRLAAASGDPDLAQMAGRIERPRVVVEEDSRVVLGDFRYFYPAASLTAWSFDDGDLREAALARLEAARPARLDELAADGEVVDPTIPLETILEKGVAGTSGSSGELAILEVQPALLYLPVAVFSLAWGSRVFEVVISELDGKALSGTLPVRRDWPVAAGVFLTAGAGFVLGQMFRALWSASAALTPAEAQAVRPWEAALLAATFLLAAGGLDLAWALLRTPFVLRVTGGGTRLDREGPVPPNPLNPLRRLLASALAEGAAGVLAPRRRP